jgi:acetate---CoA ligase (ADP-forming)
VTDAAGFGGSVLDALRPLFKPEDIAIIGASKSPGKQGHTAVVNVRKAGFPGGIFPINPAGGEVEGLRCYASIAEVPRRVDCALMVIPAGASVQAVRNCAAAGVRALIIAATGYAELGTEEGKARQDEIVRIARGSGMRIMGPNTNGLFNATDRLSLGYNTSHGDPLSSGPVSIAAHSGALFNAVAPRLREMGVGLSKYVPVGNEADLSLLDFFEYFVADDDTRIIGLILESIADGARFRALAQRAQAAGKPVVALKLGRSKAGAGAAEAHSARLAGNARAVDALLRECGVGSVSSTEALVGACAVLNARRNAPSSKAGLVCIATSGGGASMMADHAAAFGLPLAGNPDGSWGGRVAEAIALFAGAASVRNPADTGSIGGHDNIDKLFAAQEADGYCGPTLVFAHNFPDPEASRRLAGRMAARQQRTRLPVVVIAPGGLASDVVEQYRVSGIPYFRDAATAFHALRAYHGTEVHIVSVSSAPATLGDVEQLLVHGPAFLSEIDSAAILRLAGIPIVESRVAANESAALDAAVALGYPVALKALAPGVAHKNHAGLVIVGLHDASAVRTAFAVLEERIGAARAETEIIVQPMISAKAELIVGVSREGALGHFLLAGLGGIYAEVLDEITLIPVPIAPETIRSRLAQSKAGALARHVGGHAAVDAVVRVLASLQDLILAHGNRIESVDINPLLLGDGVCLGVDALVVPRS